ncbi:MAG: hypothetical protein ACRERU_05025 [Methylococcales bacterium]
MSNQNNSKSAQVAQIFTKITNSIIGLQKSNPKVFYGGAVALLIVFLFTFVGSGTEETVQMTMNLVNGQNYVMKNPNGGEVLLTTRPIFGSAGSGEDTNVCLVKPDTVVKVVEQTMANFITYVEVEPQGGDCQGKSGWTSKVNIKQ